MAGSIIFEFLDKLFLLQILATFVTYYTIRLTLFLKARHKRYQLLKYYGIPGPKPRLFDGSLSLYTKDKMTFNTDRILKEQYGKIFGLFFGDSPEVAICDPEMLRVIFIERMSSFQGRGPIYLNNPITKSVLFASFNRWKVMRKIMSTSMNSYTIRGDASMEFIEDTIKAMLKYIDERMAAEQSTGQEDKGVDLDILDFMKATTLKMISGMAIYLPGVGIQEKEPYVQSLDYFLNNATEGAYKIAICFPFLRGALEFLSEHFEYGKAFKDIRRGLNETIDLVLADLTRAKRGEPARPPTEKRPQMIEALIRLHHEGKITRDDVISNCEAILIAGYDTTSTTLSYIFWVLGKHTEIQERLRSDLMAHGTESEYLEQVINEVMRLYPTVINFITRLATETVVVGNTTIPSGTTVAYKTWLMHRDPDLWPEPERFDPERFKKGVNIHPCAFAPFGLGERKCLGIQLAQLELKMITCDVLMRYRLVTKAPQDLQLVTHALTLTKPAEKIILNVTRL